MRSALFLLGILGRGLLWLLCALLIVVAYAKAGGRAYPITWSAAAVTVLPLAIRALAACIRRRLAHSRPLPPSSVYRTPAAPRQPTSIVHLPVRLMVDTLVPVAFIACVMALDYDPSEPELVKMCCCAPC